jgi:hypothetical protein
MTLADMQSKYNDFFKDVKEGTVYTDPSFGGASFTRLSGNNASFTDAKGNVSFLRSTDSLLEVAKRIPELRALWERTFGISLPSYDVGTNLIQKDQIAQLHKGEAVLPAKVNPWNPANAGKSTDDGRIAALENSVSNLSIEMKTVAVSSNKTIRLLERLSNEDDSLRVKVVS